MHVILMDILTSHGGWLCVEKEVPLSELWSYELEGMIDVLGVIPATGVRAFDRDGGDAGIGGD
jgi:hypothetical protein